MNQYQLKKDKIRDEAIDFQLNFSENNYSYFELFKIQNYFSINAKKYGLIKEFKENGII